ncbi:SMC-Scp complex subunit ScpB [Micromonospora sp. 4G57]|uniref:SMC-Scp complex subunit ScpB n=1 Tax=Micromonospora sicca TaxID=2202420 RepID=A0ABU5JNB6_9ACTN|nr:MULTISPECIES: SMC-Scp complex subunit ScpB [unclassified Micromonospora]MDZ5447175.1 SMC-Scp complex subunit ScpB [Micromonospora sp. 4G57]MDZ5493878.1 SMC-Scp complex subunit ScpB [Micromonospora sp. 4G53]
MSDEEGRDTLADQAAAWVPPWERPAPPRPTPAPDSREDEPSPQQPESGDMPEEPADPAPAASADQVPSAVDGDPTGPAGVAADSAGKPAEHVDSVGEPAEQADSADEAAAQVEPGERGAAAGVPKKQPAGRRRATPAPEPAPELDDAELRGALEAILLVVDEPASELTLAEVLEQPAERIGPMLDEIAAGYTAAGHGFELRRAAGGWRLYTRPEYATYVERFVLDGQSVRLTQAALETLAVIAYKQPVTRSRISAIRGVNCDGVIRTLVSRGLVEECGTEPDSGAFLYRTTTMFLEKLGLNSVHDLPPLAPFLPDDVEELADATR